MDEERIVVCRDGAKDPLGIHLAHHFQVAADHAFVPQNGANLIVAVHRNAPSVRRFHGRRFACPQLATEADRVRICRPCPQGQEQNNMSPVHRYIVAVAAPGPVLQSGGMPRRVAIFVTCLVDQLFPDAGMAMVDVLERLGFEVEFREGQTCCAQPAFNSGFHSDARPVARHFLEVFDGAESIVVPSGSCTSMISHHFEELFAGDPVALARVHALTPKVFEFSDFLLRFGDLDKLDSCFPHTVTYHDSCHALRELQLKSAPRQLLAKVRDLKLVEMEAAEECCGFGGTFSVKFAEISGAMARTKVDSILKTGASHVVSLDSSCLMQLRGALSRGGHPVQTVHLAEVLASRK